MIKQIIIVILVVLCTMVLDNSMVVEGSELKDLGSEQQESSHSPMDYIVREQYYGEMLPWEEVQSFMPRKSTFHVIDLDTGLSFQVQKRAGKQHADVQPLTKKDTLIMKEIYNNTWSWKRRAILVHIDGRFIAASMHGMPHGGGALINGFPGHFCIHFAGSITHRTRNADPTHQLMVLKAAGKLKENRDQMNPDEVVDLFLTAINQDDPYLLQMTLFNAEENIGVISEKINQVSMVSRHSYNPKSNDIAIIALELPVELEYYKIGKRGNQKKTFTFQLIRDDITSRWGIQAEDFLNINSPH